MEPQELEVKLDALTVALAGKTKTEIKTALEVHAGEVKTAFDAELATTKTELLDEVKKVQDYADKLDVKLQAKTAKDNRPADELKAAIRENFDKIKTVRKGHGVAIEIKQGDMTLAASLTGDQPRVYQNTVEMVPRDMVNFTDLIRSFPIDGGTFTFPQETGGEGTIGIQVEGVDKEQVDYDFTMVDVNTDFLAGFAVYSKKMANNLAFLENFLPDALRRDYFKAENLLFYADAVAGVPASTVVDSNNQVENIIENSTLLMNSNFMANAVLVNPTDYGEILVTAGPQGSGDYSLPGVVSILNGVISINGIAVIPASWVPINLYIIGDWSGMAKVITQGLAVNFFEQDADNVRKNNITARVESQIALAILQPNGFRAGDFTAVAP